MANRLKKDDMVIVTAGKDKGKTGRILKIMRDEGRVIIEGVNLIKRHQSPRKFREAGIIEREASIHVSNVMLIDPESNKPTRVRVSVDGEGKKTRIAVKSGASID